MPLTAFLTPWLGPACRHIPVDAPFGVVDFRYAGRSSFNRWNRRGEPTLYLASDRAVAIAEFARHLRDDNDPAVGRHAITRRLFDLQVRLDAILDLRDPDVCAALALSGAPACFLDVEIARATADYVRRTTPAQALLVPSMAFLDDPHRWVMVLLLEKLPDDPSLFLPSVTVDGVFGVEP